MANLISNNITAAKAAEEIEELRYLSEDKTFSKLSSKEKAEILIADSKLYAKDKSKNKNCIGDKAYKYIEEDRSKYSNLEAALMNFRDENQYVEAAENYIEFALEMGEDLLSAIHDCEFVASAFSRSRGFDYNNLIDALKDIIEGYLEANTIIKTNSSNAAAAVNFAGAMPFMPQMNPMNPMINNNNQMVPMQQIPIMQPVQPARIPWSNLLRPTNVINNPTTVRTDNVVPAVQPTPIQAAKLGKLPDQVVSAVIQPNGIEKRVAQYTQADPDPDMDLKQKAEYITNHIKFLNKRKLNKDQIFSLMHLLKNNIPSKLKEFNSKTNPDNPELFEAPIPDNVTEGMYDICLTTPAENGVIEILFNTKYHIDPIAGIVNNTSFALIDNDGNIHSSGCGCPSCSSKAASSSKARSKSTTRKKK